MKPLKKFNQDYFQKYDDAPVKLIPYPEKLTKLADKYIDLVRQTLQGISVETKIIGSVAYQIPTADVEIAVYTKKESWKKVLILLENRFGKPVYSQ